MKVACNCKNSNSEPAAGQVVAAENAEVAARRKVAGWAAARREAAGRAAAR